MTGINKINHHHHYQPSTNGIIIIIVVNFFLVLSYRPIHPQPLKRTRIHTNSVGGGREREIMSNLILDDSGHRGRGIYIYILK